MIMEDVNRAWGGVTFVRECDSHQGGVKKCLFVLWRGVMVM